MYQVLKALFVRHCRLVRVVGPRGIGKGAVAKAVGHFVAKRQMWGDVLVWLETSARKPFPELDRSESACDSNCSIVSLLQDLYTALEEEQDDTQDGTVLSSTAQSIWKELYDKKALLIISTKELPDRALPKLGRFLDGIFERTKHVKVLLVNRKLAAKRVKSKNVAGFSCPEAMISLAPLDITSSLSLFGKLCQHTSPNSWSPDDVVRTKPEETLSRILGDGIPAKIRVVAKNMTLAEYEKLVHPTNSALCLEDFPSVTDSLRGMPEDIEAVSRDDCHTFVRASQTDENDKSSGQQPINNPPDSTMRSQAEVCLRFCPILKQSKVYRKSVTSFIRKAIKGEHIVTSLNGVQETQQTVKDDSSWVVYARAAGEYYVVSDEEFRSNYETNNARPIDPASPSPLARRLRSEGYQEYCSVRRIQAHKVDVEDMSFFVNTGRETSAISDTTTRTPAVKDAAHFVAPWGQPMRVELGDYLAMTYPTATKEVYRIEQSAFGVSYVDCAKNEFASALWLYAISLVGAKNEFSSELWLYAISLVVAFFALVYYFLATP